MKTLT